MNVNNTVKERLTVGSSFAKVIITSIFAGKSKRYEIHLSFFSSIHQYWNSSTK